MNQGPDILARGNLLDIAANVKVENHQRQAILSAHRQRRLVHHRQPGREDFRIGNLRISSGIGKANRIFVVDAVDLSGLGDQIGLDFDGAQRRRGVGRKEGAAGAGRKDDNVSGA